MSATPRSRTPLIVAVEGLCFAGKTTLARALARRLATNVVAEYADLAPLPGFPPASQFAARAALLGFLALESGRARSARELGRPLVLYDRSPLTLIAHEHAMASLAIASDPRAAASWFSGAAAAGAIIAPDAYLHLVIADQAFDTRQARRGPLPPHLVSPPVRAAISRVYDTYFAAVSPDRVLRLDGCASLAQLTAGAARFIDDLPGHGTGPAPDWAVLANGTASIPAARAAA